MRTGSDSLAIDRLFDFPGNNGRRARCRLRIFDPGPDRPQVILVSARETNGDRDTSITARVDILADLVAREHRDIVPQDCLWVEHYPGGSLPESFHRVRFRPSTELPPFHRPQWSRMSRAGVEFVIGGPIGD